MLTEEREEFLVAISSFLFLFCVILILKTVLSFSYALVVVGVYVVSVLCFIFNVLFAKMYHRDNYNYIGI